MKREDYHRAIKEHGIYETRAHMAVDIVLDAVVEELEERMDGMYPALLFSRLYGLIHDIKGNSEEMEHGGIGKGKEEKERQGEIPQEQG